AAGEYVMGRRDDPATRIVGIWNRTRNKAASLLRQHGVEAQVFDSVDDLINDDRVQIVASVTHPNMRLEHVEKAARAGRHIVIEKPIGLSLEETLRCRDAVAQAGVKTVTSFVLRWNPQFETLRQLIKEGVLGQLIYAEGDYWHPLKKHYPGYRAYASKAIGRSPMTSGGCHAVDMVRHLAGDT